MLIIQYIVDGVMIGLIYGLIALAFNIIYRSGRILNLAQGQIICLGAFFVWTAISFMKLPMFWGFLLVLGVFFIVAILIEEIVFKPLIGQNLFAITIATVALMIMLDGAMQMIWGARERPFPVFLPMDPYIIAGTIITKQLIGAAIAAVLLIVGLNYFFLKNKWGLSLSAIAEDHMIAQSMGISVRKSILIAWIISSFISVVIAVFLLNGASFSFKTSSIGLRAVPVALLAGLESISGAVLAGLIIGIGEALSGYFLDEYTEGIMSQAFPFIVMIAILIIRPQGLFGWKIIERV